MLAFESTLVNMRRYPSNRPRWSSRAFVDEFISTIYPSRRRRARRPTSESFARIARAAGKISLPFLCAMPKRVIELVVAMVDDDVVAPKAERVLYERPRIKVVFAANIVIWCRAMLSND